jgi:hypothetical protein
VNPVEWKAQSKGGMLITSGNSHSKNFTFGVNGFRKEATTSWPWKAAWPTARVQRHGG